MSPLDNIAKDLSRRRPGHPLRVAIDGRTGAGKTTFARGLAESLRGLGREVEHVGMDAFHNPRAVRYARGRASPEGYYFDARDLDALITRLLRPLGPDGDRRYATASLDLETDQPIAPDWKAAGHDFILIVDGTFIQRPQLAEFWDAVVYLDISRGTSLERGVKREGEHMRSIYLARYLPAEDIYLSAVDPRAGAD